MFNGIFPSSLFTCHRGMSGGRGLSPRLWSRVQGQSLSPDGFSNWYFAGSDFLNFGMTTAVASNIGRYADASGAYLSYEDTGNAIAPLETEVGGVIRISLDATDNDETWIQPGTAKSVLGKVSDTAGQDKLMLFESRFRVGQINEQNVLIGLSEEGLAVADTISDAGALADKDFLGFFIQEGSGSALKFGYRKSGQALQTLATFGTSLVASTWYKVGFVYDPSAPSAKRLAWYVDNVEQSTYVTATNIADATFPDGEELNLLAGIKNGTAAIRTLDLDWWNFAQAG